MFKDPVTSISSSCVKWQLASLFILAAVFSGCATTQTKTQNEQIETRVTELEKNLQAKDAQIVDLQYQVKDLTSKIDSLKPAESEQVATGPQGPQNSTDQAGPVKPSEVSDSSQIIRVKVSPEKIQRALKSAGV